MEMTKEQYLKKHHKKDIERILKGSNYEETLTHALTIDLTILEQNYPQLFAKVIQKNNFWIERSTWMTALKNILYESNSQLHGDTIRNCSVSFNNLPDRSNCLLGLRFTQQLIQIDGNVVNQWNSGKKEIKREHKCRRCNLTKTFKAQRDLHFYFNVPDKCPNGHPLVQGSDSSEVSQAIVHEFYIDYQEIQIQAKGWHMLLAVELDGETVGSCSVGDNVTICGTLEVRCKKNDIESMQYVLRAVNVFNHDRKEKTIEERSELFSKVSEIFNETLEKFNGNELLVRDEIVESFASAIEGLAFPKLGLLLTLCSGIKSNQNEGQLSSLIQTQSQSEVNRSRQFCHFLLIGDPGLGKSQLLNAAAEVSINSVRTVGYGTTTAGLTATVVSDRENSHIVAGALIKANNGICCIDEINLMKKEHQGSLHEVMESGQISITNAYLKGSIPTKVSIIGAMNKKNHLSPVEASNVTIEQSLLSRFDLIYDFEDPKDPTFDAAITKRILNKVNNKAMPRSWSVGNIRDHINVAKEIRVNISNTAQEVLNKYYNLCMLQKDIDHSRVTPRLLDSLERLTICNAKLLLRHRAGVIDALTVVMLMDTSWSFGCLKVVQRQNVLQSTVPLGPSNDYIDLVLQKLNLEHFKHFVEKERQPRQGTQTELSEFLADGAALIQEEMDYISHNERWNNSDMTLNNTQLFDITFSSLSRSSASFKSPQPSQVPENFQCSVPSKWNQYLCSQNSSTSHSISSAASSHNSSSFTTPKSPKPSQVPENFQTFVPSITSTQNSEQTSQTLYDYFMSRKKSDATSSRNSSSFKTPEKKRKIEILQPLISNPMNMISNSTATNSESQKSGLGMIALNYQGSQESDSSYSGSQESNSSQRSSQKLWENKRELSRHDESIDEEDIFYDAS